MGAAGRVECVWLKKRGGCSLKGAFWCVCVFFFVFLMLFLFVFLFSFQLLCFCLFFFGRGAIFRKGLVAFGLQFLFKWLCLFLVWCFCLVGWLCCGASIVMFVRSSWQHGLCSEPGFAESRFVCKVCHNRQG